MLNLLGAIFSISGFGALVAGAAVDISGAQACILSQSPCTPPGHGVGDALLVGGIISSIIGIASIATGIELQKDTRAKLSVSARGLSFVLVF
jgi:hypothetical protein